MPSPPSFSTIFTTTLIMVTITTTLIQLVNGDSRKDLLESCKKHEDGYTCIGYNEAGSSDCSGDVEKCNFAFAAIKKNSDDDYKVKLVGKGSGWVGIAFSENEGSVMQADNLGIVCVSGSNPAVRILKIQQRPGSATPFEFDDSSLADSVSDGKLDVKDGWMTCEFKLKSKPKHSKKTLDLKGMTYKIGLAGHPERGIDDRYPNQPTYHGVDGRGSSAGKLDTFQKVLSNDAAATTKLGSTLMIGLICWISYYCFMV